MKRKKPARKRTPETFKVYIGKLCEQLRWLFYLNAYKMHLCWKLDTVIEGEHADGHVAAEVDVDTVYLNLTVRFYKPILDMYTDNDDDAVLETVLHEFCHSLFSPLTCFVGKEIPKELDDAFYKLVERQTQLATQVISSDKFKTLKGILK